MKQGIDVSTNPSNSLLTVKLLKEPCNNSSIDIYNKSGKLVKQVKITGQRTSIRIKSLTPGLYLLIFISGREVKAARFFKH
jgi:flagellar hook assembly protein FlgD